MGSPPPPPGVLGYLSTIYYLRQFSQTSPPQGLRTSPISLEACFVHAVLPLISLALPFADLPSQGSRLATSFTLNTRPVQFMTSSSTAGFSALVIGPGVFARRALLTAHPNSTRTVYCLRHPLYRFAFLVKA